jgi:hypothetical protein
MRFERTWIAKACCFQEHSREWRYVGPMVSPNCRPQDPKISFDVLQAHETRGLCLLFAHYALINGCNPWHTILIRFSLRLSLISRAFQLFYHTPSGFSVEQTFGSTISRYDPNLKRISLSASSIASVPLPS